MNDLIAERLLATVMNWTPQDVKKERPDLQALATYRYDEYQQFSTGMRFIESFALWLRQFTPDERKIAYEFVKKKLVFVSGVEIAHFVKISYPDVIRPLLIKRVSLSTSAPEWYVKKIIEGKEFRILRRQSLFLGLSDGAHVDIFRRANVDISHEQILRSHEIPNERALDLIKNLANDLRDILQREPSSDESHFKMIFLLDDFSGSGISYIREENSSTFKGKIANFYYNICKNPAMADLLVNPDIHVCLILYMATERALHYLENIGSKLFNTIPFMVKAVHLLQDSITLDCERNKEFIRIMENYYDNKIETTHYMKGRHTKPYMGFDECALPLILNHNTPNNTVPLLWFEEPRKYYGLFPRVSRFQG